MFKKLITINLLLMLIFQPIGQAFSAPVFLLDHHSGSSNVDMSAMVCDQEDSMPCLDLECCELVGHAKCDLNNPIGYSVSNQPIYTLPSSYNGIYDNKYLLILPDTLLRPPQNT